MPRVRIVLIETFVLLGIVASSHHAFAKKPVASLCNNGRFITNAPPLVSSQVDIAGFFSLTLTPASSGKATLVVPATHRLLTDSRGLPTGSVEAVEGTPYDFRRPRPIGDVGLDTCYLGLIRDEDGLARVRVDGAVLWIDERYAYLQLFTGDTLPDPAERRRGLAVEPMTCPPDAFRTGTGVIVLPPGGSVTARWGLAAGVTPSSPRRAGR